MTKEQQLDWLCRLRSEIYVYMPQEWIKKMDEALTQSIKALEQEPSGDAVSRQAVLSYINRIQNQGIGKKKSFEFIQKFVEKLSSAEKIGHWIRWYEIIEEEGCTIYDPHCKCSECGKEYDPYISQFIKYCNECGARMG